MLKYRKCRHEWYHGAYVTYFDAWGGGISLGMFVFVAEDTQKIRDIYTNERGMEFTPAVQRALTVHEYGHTVQSLMLGPLYLIFIGLPSVLWAQLGKKYRAKHGVAYTAFWCEKWANKLGEAVTKEVAWDK